MTLSSIEYKLLPKTFNVETLISFILAHGNTEYNLCPEQRMRDHFNKLKSGEIFAWGAFLGEIIVGLITAELGGQFCLHYGEKTSAEIKQFVVHSEHRGMGIGTALVNCAKEYIFTQYRDIKEIYVMIHASNLASSRAFIKEGFAVIITFDDPFRNRNTTVFKVKKAIPSTKLTRVLGMQSGNAVDGIDMVVVDFEEPLLSSSRTVSELKYHVVAFETFPWLKEKRQEIFALREGNLQGCNAANYGIAKDFVETALTFLAKHSIPKTTIDLVSSHGQSIHGNPRWEIGELSSIAQGIGITTVGDFRSADVAAGGKGAPCTCTYDSLMLRPPEGSSMWRICINIGGTSSVTFCPPQGSVELPYGLDPGLGVLYIDWAANKCNPNLEYDQDGKLGLIGKINKALLDEMLQHPHFQKNQLPISAGPHVFTRSCFDRWHQQAKELGCTDQDFVATLTELSAMTIALACKKFGPCTDDIIVRGGVRNNLYFMERLRVNLCHALGQDIQTLRSLNELGFEEKSWETVLYAMMGFLCIKGLYNFVPSCTGASHPVVGGKICPGNNFSSIELQVLDSFKGDSGTGVA